MSKYMDEFKEFIAKGNVMDMAVGVIIGGAFTGIVTALTDNISNPLISTIAGGTMDEAGNLVGNLVIFGMDFGAFISAIINFLIVAFIVFNMVKAVNAMKSTLIKEEPAEEPAPAPVCPYCLEEVKEGATRCPHCTGVIEGGAHVA